jgi:formylglycine-generating enzyme required for sulfatase activity
MGFVFGDLLQKPASKPKARTTPAPRSVPKPVAAPIAEAKQAATPTTNKTEGIRDCPACPEMLVLPAGTFTMGEKRGDRSERPVHKVSIKRPFAIGKYEVTIGQWNECVKDGACSYKAAKGGPTENFPVRDISWNDAQEYVRWLSQKTKQEYRLPSEAEWEYSARANRQTRFWWGDTVGTGNANCKDCGGKWDHSAPAEVDAYPPNPFGVYGANGGVWEWVNDCWHKSYDGAPKDGSSWDKPDCRENVIRGGSWRNDASYVHSASRFKYDTNVRYLLNGFRVAKTLR